MECWGPIPLLAAATTILSATGAVIAVICFGIAMLLLRQLFYIEDIVIELIHTSHVRMTAHGEALRRLASAVEIVLGGRPRR